MLLLSSAGNICTQFGPRSGPTERRVWSGSKLFDTVVVVIKDFFEKTYFEKKSADDNESMKSTQHANS